MVNQQLQFCPGIYQVEVIPLDEAEENYSRFVSADREASALAHVLKVHEEIAAEAHCISLQLLEVVLPS